MVWKDVKEVSGYYQVSDHGDVRRTSSGRLLKPKKDKDGYLEYCLCVDNKRKYRRGHRLVAIAFIPNIENKPEVNHKDNIKHHNYLGNLEWVTDAENNQHYYADYHSEDKGLCNLNHKDWQDILKLHIEGKSYKEISKVFNLKVKRPDTIGDVLAGNRLSSLTGFTSDMRLTNNLVSTKVLDEDILLLLKDYYTNSRTNKQCCAKYGLSPAQVSRIVNGTRRKGILDQFKKDNNIE
tara:strand:+ start:134 stop:841 length:708 start_codon:yes stop_codon:yes gene_type:complete